MHTNVSFSLSSQRGRTPARKRPLAAALLLLLGLPTAHAATILVTRSDDGSVANECTVRDAVAAANTNAAVAGCTAGSDADTIQFAPDVVDITLTAAAGGTLSVTDALTLDGQETLVTLRRDPADAPFRIVEALTQNGGPAAPLELDWIKISGGNGGGIFTMGGLTLRRSEVSNNVSDGKGGGIFANGSLTLVDSVVSGNATLSQNGEGGGIHCYCTDGISLTRSIVSNNATLGIGGHGGGIATIFSPLELIDSRIEDNWTDGDGSFGGGLVAIGTTATLRDSTVSGNSTSGDNSWGGGAYAYELHLNSSTISGNSTSGFASYGGGIAAAFAYLSNSTVSSNATTGEAADGGGIFAGGGAQLDNSTVFANRAAVASGGGMVLWPPAGAVPSLESSLVFGNSAGGDADLGYAGEEVLQLGGGRNLIGVTSAMIEPPADTLHCDPLLLPLASNGGATLTHRLGDGSCAIDAGSNPDALEFDQRGAGHARMFGAAVDIGALERQPADELIFADGFDSP